MKKLLMQYMNTFTALSDKEQQAIVDKLQIEEFKKGTDLLRQGDIPIVKCYFVLKGCVRQYFIDETGKEITANFFTEEQAIPVFHEQNQETPSRYSLTCLEDSVLVVVDAHSEKIMYKSHSELETMTRAMMEIALSTLQDEYAQFMSHSPEERYKTIIRKRPQLLHRVPQHQLASYLGMTPESLSRIKKRLKIER